MSDDHVRLPLVYCEKRFLNRRDLDEDERLVSVGSSACPRRRGTRVLYPAVCILAKRKPKRADVAPERSVNHLLCRIFLGIEHPCDEADSDGERLVSTEVRKAFPGCIEVFA